MNIDSSLIGKTISFEIYPSAILSDDFTNVTVCAIASHEGVTNYIQPAIMHAKVYPALPDTVPVDYRLIDYVVIRLPNGTLTALGIPWIKEVTVTVSGSIELIATIRGQSVSDIARIRQILSENNITDVTITHKSGS
jgi:hypothetical protein